MTYNEELNKCLAAIKDGDQTKFYDLNTLTYAPLLKVAKSYLVNKSDAEDVIADLHYRLIMYADRYDKSRDAYDYLWQIVKNRAYDYNKKHLRENTVDLSDFEIGDIDDYKERSNTKIDISEALRKVGNINTLIIIWTYRDDLTQEEIGKRLNISRSAVCQRLSKTLVKLRKYLKKY